jgi:O-acetyl-ADP-ribose deacetylase (regulator of RNase III)
MPLCLAMREILVSVLLYNFSRNPPIRSVAMSGLATSVGGISPDDAATQMRAAYDNVISSEWRHIVSPVQAPFALREHRT